MLKRVNFRSYLSAPVHLLEYQTSKSIGMLEGVYETIVVLSVVLLFSAVALTGCELVADIFKAGVRVGALLVIGVIAIVIWLVAKLNR